MFNHLRGPARGWPSRWFAWMGLRRPELSARKLRLFVCACFRRHDAALGSDWSRSVLATAERRADERAGIEEVARALAHAPTLEYHPDPDFPITWTPERDLVRVLEMHDDHEQVEGAALSMGAFLMRPDHRPEVLREIFGNPFRASPFHPAWRSDAVLAVARQIYDAQDFSALPVLADALEDAGCY